VQVEMLGTMLDCFRLASASALRSAQDTVRRVLALAGGTSPRPVRTLLAASAHIFARPEFLRAMYRKSGTGSAAMQSANDIGRQECQLLQVRASLRPRLTVLTASVLASSIPWLLLPTGLFIDGC
jgi:hypothetical protein